MNDKKNQLLALVMRAHRCNELKSSCCDIFIALQYSSSKSANGLSDPRKELFILLQ